SAFSCADPPLPGTPAILVFCMFGISAIAAHPFRAGDRSRLANRRDRRSPLRHVEAIISLPAPLGYSQQVPFLSVLTARYCFSAIPKAETVPQAGASGAAPLIHAREGDRLADVRQAGDPGRATLDAHAEAGMGHAAVAPQVEIPLVGFAGQGVLLSPPLQ